MKRDTSLGLRTVLLVPEGPINWSTKGSDSGDRLETDKDYMSTTVEARIVFNPYNTGLLFDEAHILSLIPSFILQQSTVSRRVVCLQSLSPYVFSQASRLHPDILLCLYIYVGFGLLSLLIPYFHFSRLNSECTRWSLKHTLRFLSLSLRLSPDLCSFSFSTNLYDIFMSN